MTMLRRNGSAPKVIGGLVAFFGLVYLIYLYNDVSGQLKDTENTAERYRRESENVAAQLQVEFELKGRLQRALFREKQTCKSNLDDEFPGSIQITNELHSNGEKTGNPELLQNTDITIAKGELKQRYENDRQEFTNRLTALQQQHKMLKSQHEDMQSEYHRLQKEHEDEAEDHKQIDEQRNVEYNQFKQEKALEVSNLKDQVANYKRDKIQLTEEISELKKKLQESFNQINTDQQTIANLQQELLNHKNAAAQQQQNLPVQGGAQQGANLQQGAQQGNLFQQLQGNRQFMQPAVQQGGLFQQNQHGENIAQQQQGQHILGQPGQLLGQQQGQLGQQQGQVGQQQGQVDQQEQHVGQDHGLLGQNFNPFGVPQQPQQPIVRDNWLGQQQDSKDLQKDSKQEAERVIKEQEFHQLKPPQEPDIHAEEGLGHQKLGQEMIGLSKDKDLHRYEENKQIAKPDFNPQIPHPDTGGDDDDNHEGAADGAGDHDNRIEHQAPVNLQVQEPVFKDHAEPQKPLVDEANLKFRPIMPEDVVQQVMPQAHDDSVKKEQIDHPLVDHQDIKGHNIDDVKNEEKNLGPLEEDDDDENYDDDEYDNGEKDEH